jgi:hypothetical protein
MVRGRCFRRRRWAAHWSSAGGPPRRRLPERAKTTGFVAAARRSRSHGEISRYFGPQQTIWESSSAPHAPGDRSAGQRRYDDDNRRVSAANLQERQFRIAMRRTKAIA